MKMELDRLVSEGIIQKVEATEWLSPVVMARKSNGEPPTGYCFCLTFTARPGRSTGAARAPRRVRLLPEQSESPGSD
ncbi:hypothetical protein NDU88_006302 [Pleurodeles waltl]|uniref:Reverse transcriptase n=1 Tax=Pleurodeles waltl TaxID=8319 RepID=A0AAV7N326_PLEWA|nr:hypothetical protein NDU88_006302 [Pleurodeles waltl]